MTNRRTREDCVDEVRYDGIVGCGDALAYLSYGSLSEQDQLDAAGRLRTIAGISHLVYKFRGELIGRQMGGGWKGRGSVVRLSRKLGWVEVGGLRMQRQVCNRRCRS